MPVDFKKKMQNLRNRNQRETPKDIVDMKREAALLQELKMRPLRDVDYACIKEGQSGKEFSAPIIHMNQDLKLYAIQGAFKDVPSENCRYTIAQNDGIAEFIHKIQKMTAKSPKSDAAPKETEPAPVEQ